MTNEKIFLLDTKTDFIVYLNRLIFYTHKFFNRFRNYRKELEKIIIKSNIDMNSTTKIKEETYDSICDKIYRIANILFNLIGDDTKAAMSYNKFRKHITRKGDKELSLPALDREMIELINKFRDERNWGAHVPESLLVASLKIVDIAKEDHPNKYENFISNPIRITVFEYYDGKWLLNLLNEVKAIEQECRKVFQQMKKDYSILIGQSVTIEPYKIKLRSETDIAVPQISKDIQLNNHKNKDLRNYSIWYADDE